MNSPPKRITRARAAAKATGGTVKTTKIMTAAVKAKSAPAASASTRAAKRKTRPDDDEANLEPEDKPSPPKKATRGRPKKASTEEEQASSAPTTRAARTMRTAKPAATRVTAAEAAPAPARATRGRPRKAAQPESTQPTETASQVRPTRTRAATSTKTGASSTTQPTMKKSVKFQEPDKENVEPASKKETVATGLKARPAKKRGPAPASKPSTQKPASGDKKPLSPKKVTQVSVCRDYESEDELAGSGYTPTIKQLQKSPVKPPNKSHTSPNSDELQEGDIADPDSTMQVNEAILNPPNFGLTSMASPARRMPASPFKDTMKSPARKIGPISFPGSALKSANKVLGSEAPTPFKSSLLQSSAKRPPSPIKGLQLGLALTSHQPQSSFKASLFQSPAKRAMPGLKPLLKSRATGSDHLPGSPHGRHENNDSESARKLRPSDKLLSEEDASNSVPEEDAEELFMKPITKIHFSGRLSAVLPRDADPDDDTDLFDDGEDAATISAAAVVDQAVTEVSDMPVNEPNISPDVKDRSEASRPEADKPVADEIVVQTGGVTSTPSPVKSPKKSSSQTLAPQPNPSFELREKDLECGNGMDSDEDDDSLLQTMATPTTVSLAVSQGNRRSTLGFTALAEQFCAWSATSPAKTPGGKMLGEAAAPLESAGQASKDTIPSMSPVDVNFFEDEMHVSYDGGRPDDSEKADQQEHLAGSEVEDPIFDDIMVVDEDVDLINEANELSLMEPKAPSFQDDTLSDASQEYGDENDVPVDPRMEEQRQAPVTPIRPAQQRFFHTTTKVPLKPAAEPTPSPLKKRSFSASRVAPRRPTASASGTGQLFRSPGNALGDSTTSAPVTPRGADASDADLLSTVGSPARTPRKDLNPVLLRGAVVHVDVHTKEGADASGIFVELLTNMGARCVKTWHWNPDGSTNDGSSSNKVGITHVVFKDGGKRTLERVRRSNGVVQCVGVSWVLDCERENEWLDEAPYYFDTSLVPRGGARRRKSMEPKALANMNGTLVNNGSKGQSTGSASDGQGWQSAPKTPRDRRQSTMWMHTPSDHSPEDDDIEWSQFILTPVPKTPAPEAVSRYAAELPETPDGSNGDDTEESPTKQAVMTRTCPPKASSRLMLSNGPLSRDAEDHVMMRLMSARRKSLQFAPKIGSPLAKSWA